MNFAFIVLLPVVFWCFIVGLIITVAKPKRRGQSATRTVSQRNTAGRVTPRRNTKLNFDRPKMREGLFDINLGKKPQKQTKNTMFSNTGYDDYSVIGRKKDYVSGYDKKYSKENVWSRRSTAMQYSHTYDGHEPWDKCLPKEKDPWDKDFYA